MPSHDSPAHSITVAAACAALLVAASVALAAPAADVIAAVGCADKAMPWLEKWGSRNRFLPYGDPSGSQVAYRSPTDAFGRWVAVGLSEDRVVVVASIAADGITRIGFDENCAPSSPQTTSAGGFDSNDANSITDAKAERIVAGNDSGIFYSWSSHMPLSVDGYREIAAAAESLGIALTPVLSEHSNDEFSAREAIAAGIPESALAKNHSVELIMRDLHVHAPAILVYSDGKFVSPVIPGFRRAGDYETLLRRFLD